MRTHDAVCPRRISRLESLHQFHMLIRASYQLDRCVLAEGTQNQRSLDQADQGLHQAIAACGHLHKTMKLAIECLTSSRASAVRTLPVVKGRPNPRWAALGPCADALLELDIGLAAFASAVAFNVVREIRVDRTSVDQFANAFNRKRGDVGMALIQTALSANDRTLSSGGSTFDAYLNLPADCCYRPCPVGHRRFQLSTEDRVLK